MANLGFLFIKNADVPSQDLVRDMFALSKEFFEGESLEEKEKVSVTVQNRGWIGNRQEALDTGGHPKGDLKEAFNLSKFTAGGQPMQPLPPTLSKHSALPKHYSYQTTILLLGMYTTANKAPFSGFYITRHLIYRMINARVKSEQVRTRTMKSLGGLQLQLPNGKWLDAPVVDDAVLVNIGDLFDFWSGGRYPSTVHRVALPTGPEAGQARYSIAYFLHPTDDVLLSRIPIKDDTEDQHARTSVYERFGVDADEKMTAREWLDRRLAPTYKSRKEE
ncbi:2OG-Fe(II) oxygenase family oxidoreductase, partial [Rhizoctonia solani AG-3 Rhs1AP]